MFEVLEFQSLMVLVDYERVCKPCLIAVIRNISS